MNKEIKIKNIVICTIILATLWAFFDYFVKPYEYINLNFIQEFIDKSRQSQQIAPNRLYINAWRNAKSEYVDSSMNNQDWKRWRNRYQKHIKTIDDADIAINTMLSSLNDRYTMFLKEKSYTNQKSILDSKITGVGIVFNSTGKEVVVNNILNNSSAKENNIQTGDIITSINGISTNKMTSEEIQTLMEQKNETTLKIEVKRGTQTFTKTLETKEIPLQTMNYLITKDNIGIIHLSNIMGKNALSDFQNILHKTNKTKGIIIDLRNNYGGILANAVQMADFIMTEKEILSIKSRGKIKYRVYADDYSHFKKKPIIILTNNKTASAAEILAGSLHDSIGAIIVGENTYGKNSIQQIIPMASNTGMVITSDKYILPSGLDINNTGIEPDIYVEPKLTNDTTMSEAIKLVNEIVENKK